MPLQSEKQKKQRIRYERWYSKPENKLIASKRANENTKNWRKKYPQKYSEQKQRIMLRKKYGITIEQLEKIAREQRYCCAICGKVSSKNVVRISGSKVFLHVDHCHETGRIRGLLCNNCNTAIGLFGESVYSLAKAIIYLNK